MEVDTPDDDELTSSDILVLVRQASLQSLSQLATLAQTQELRDYDDLFADPQFYRLTISALNKCWRTYDAQHLYGGTDAVTDRHSRSDSGTDDDEDEVGETSPLHHRADSADDSWQSLSFAYTFLSHTLTLPEFSVTIASVRGAIDSQFIQSLIQRFEPKVKRPGANSSTSSANTHLSSEQLSQIVGVGGISATTAMQLQSVPSDMLASVGVGIGVRAKEPDVPTPLELSILRGLTHSLYKTFVNHRRLVRTNIANFFQRYVRNPVYPQGVGELLSVIGSVVKGYQLPLLASHSHFIVKEIMPLHSPNRMMNELTPVLQHYHQQLVYVLATFLEKEKAQCSGQPLPSLLPVLTSLLESWPTCHSPNSAKEVLMIHELEQLMELCDFDTFAWLLPSLLPYVLSSLSSSHHRVSERCLQLWQSDHWLALVASQRHSLFTPLLSTLFREKHWNKSVNKMRVAVINTMIASDRALFDTTAHSLFQCPTVADSLSKASAMIDSMRSTDDRQLTEEEKLMLTEAHVPKPLEHCQYNDFVFGHLLGSGSFSQVRYAKKIIKGQLPSLWPEVAIKVIDRAVIASQNYQANIDREIAIMGTLHHPNINTMIGTCANKANLYLVFEFAKNGDLFSCIVNRGSLNTETSQFLSAEILRGLEYLHGQSVVWGDCKPENVLIHASGHCKLTDFGSARYVRDVSASDRIEGTEDYLAPELLRGETGLSFASDLWAFACVLYQMLAGRTPMWAGEQQDEKISLRQGKSARVSKAELAKKAAANIVSPVNDTTSTGDDSAGNGDISSDQKQLMLARMVHFESLDDKFPPGFDANARDLIARLLVPNPAQRLGVNVDDNGTMAVDYSLIKQHSFFAGIDFANLHTKPAPRLGVGNVAAAPDAKWSRRKNSLMWAPMPAAYQFNDSRFVMEAIVEDDSERVSASSGQPVKGQYQAYTQQQQHVMPGLREVDVECEDDSDSEMGPLDDDDASANDSDAEQDYAPARHSSRTTITTRSAYAGSALPPVHPPSANLPRTFNNSAALAPPRPRIGIRSAPPPSSAPKAAASFVPNASPLVGVRAPGVNSVANHPMGNPVAQSLLNRVLGTSSGHASLPTQPDRPK